jgi:hypothetical protein
LNNVVEVLVTVDRAPEVFWDKVGDETIVCNTDIGEVHRFNNTAAFLWDNLENASVGSLANQLAAIFPDRDTTQLTADVQGFVDSLLDKKLVVVNK